MPDDEVELVLNEAEVRQVVRLLAEALTPDDGRSAKAARLMDGLAELADADGWFWIRSRVNAIGGSPINLDYLYGGAVTDANMATWSERALEVHGEPPEHAPMRRLLGLGRHFTVARPDCVADDLWHAGENAAHVARFGFDEFLYSWVPLAEANGDHLLSGCVLLRRPGKPPFDPRAMRLAHLIFAEAHPLHTLGLDTTLANKLAPLSPRTRQVLALLIDGLSVKQAAYQLDLSPHTVNGHCKVIYHHFNVSSRAELLRRFMTGKT
jgi:DNA-binding CsgD family transcriptional regulator